MSARSRPVSWVLCLVVLSPPSLASDIGITTATPMVQPDAQQQDGGPAKTTVIIDGQVKMLQQGQRPGLLLDPVQQDAARLARLRAEQQLKAGNAVPDDQPPRLGHVETTIEAQGIYSIKKTQGDNSCIQIGTVETPRSDCTGGAK